MALQTGQLSTRQSDLLRAVRERGTAALADLAREFNVSQETIRRDVKRLAAEGQVLRRHGNVAVPYSVGEAPFERRLRENAAAKRSIARRAAEMVEDGDSIILDTGTTTSIFARELLRRANLTVITNSSDIARTLATVNGNRVYLAGGELNGDNGAAFGPSTIEFVAQFRAKHAMVTIAGLTAELGPMDLHLAEAEFARMVLSRGENRVILTDHSKFERMALIKICSFEDFNRLVTDADPPPSLLQGLRKPRSRSISPPELRLKPKPVEEGSANQETRYHQEQDRDDDPHLHH